jgi:hypothetical protein
MNFLQTTFFWLCFVYTICFIHDQAIPNWKKAKIFNTSKIFEIFWDSFLIGIAWLMYGLFLW